MKQELEICVKSNISFDEMKNKLLSIGFHIQEEFQLNDIYYVENDKEISAESIDNLLSNYILVRETVSKQILLVIKRKKYDKNGDIISQSSYKCPILDREKGCDFIENLGYKKILELYDHNILFSNGINEIYLQNVQNLGTYIEMEQKNLKIDKSNGDTIDELIINLNKYNLDIDKTNYFRKKAQEKLIREVK